MLLLLFNAMEIRRRILNQMYRNTELRKAVAFSLFIKTRVKSSAVQKWSVNKLHEISGVSASAVRKRIDTLKALGLVEFTGKGNRCLVFKSLKSHTSHRNATVPNIEFVSNNQSKKNAYAQNVKFIEDTLSAMLIVEIQNRKNYAKQMIQQSKNPKNVKELKEAKKACNRFGYGEKFRENGISYKHIATELGVSLKTAFDIVEFACKKEILCKFRNIEKRFIQSLDYVKDMILNNYTYIKNNIICKVYANTYSIMGASPSACSAGMVYN